MSYPGGFSRGGGQSQNQGYRGGNQNFRGGSGNNFGGNSFGGSQNPPNRNYNQGFQGHRGGGRGGASGGNRGGNTGGNAGGNRNFHSSNRPTQDLTDESPRRDIVGSVARLGEAAPINATLDRTQVDLETPISVDDQLLRFAAENHPSAVHLRLSSASSHSSAPDLAETLRRTTAHMEALSCALIDAACAMPTKSFLYASTVAVLVAYSPPQSPSSSTPFGSTGSSATAPTGPFGPSSAEYSARFLSTLSTELSLRISSTLKEVCRAGYTAFPYSIGSTFLSTQSEISNDFGIGFDRFYESPSQALTLQHGPIAGNTVSHGPAAKSTRMSGGESVARLRMLFAFTASLAATGSFSMASVLSFFQQIFVSVGLGQLVDGLTQGSLLGGVEMAADWTNWVGTLPMVLPARLISDDPNDCVEVFSISEEAPNCVVLPTALCDALCYVVLYAIPFLTIAFKPSTTPALFLAYSTSTSPTLSQSLDGMTTSFEEEEVKAYCSSLRSLTVSAEVYLIARGKTLKVCQDLSREFSSTIISKSLSSNPFLGTWTSVPTSPTFSFNPVNTSGQPVWDALEQLFYAIHGRMPGTTSSATLSTTYTPFHAVLRPSFALLNRTHTRLRTANTTTTEFSVIELPALTQETAVSFMSPSTWASMSTLSFPEKDEKRRQSATMACETLKTTPFCFLGIPAASTASLPRPATWDTLPTGILGHLSSLDTFYLRAYVFDILSTYDGLKSHLFCALTTLPTLSTYAKENEDTMFSISSRRPESEDAFHLVVESIFSLLLTIPTSRSSLAEGLALNTIMSSLLALYPAFARRLGPFVTTLFKTAGNLHPLSRSRLALWFAHNYTHARLFWPWSAWEGFLTASSSDPIRRLIEYTLVRVIRIAPFEPVRNSLPPSAQVLLRSPVDSSSVTNNLSFLLPGGMKDVTSDMVALLVELESAMILQSKRFSHAAVLLVLEKHIGTCELIHTAVMSKIYPDGVVGKKINTGIVPVLVVLLARGYPSNTHFEAALQLYGALLVALCKHAELPLNISFREDGKTLAGDEYTVADTAAEYANIAKLAADTGNALLGPFSRTYRTENDVKLVVEGENDTKAVDTNDVNHLRVAVAEENHQAAQRTILEVLKHMLGSSSQMFENCTRRMVVHGVIDISLLLHFIVKEMAPGSLTSREKEVVSLDHKTLNISLEHLHFAEQILQQARMATKTHLKVLRAQILKVKANSKDTSTPFVVPSAITSMYTTVMKAYALVLEKGIFSQSQSQTPMSSPLSSEQELEIVLSLSPIIALDIVECLSYFSPETRQKFEGIWKWLPFC